MMLLLTYDFKKSNKKRIDTAGDGGEGADDTIIRNTTGTLLLEATIMMMGGATERDQLLDITS